MTRKDYINIATAIRATQDRISHNFRTADEELYGRDRDQQLRGVRRTAAHICDVLAADNPRFDAARFLSECGYGPTTMNPRDPALDLRPLPGEPGAGETKHWADYAREDHEASREAWAAREETVRQPRRPICEGLEDESDLGDRPRGHIG
jgi:hypothetical protein